MKKILRLLSILSSMVLAAQTAGNLPFYSQFPRLSEDVVRLDLSYQNFSDSDRNNRNVKRTLSQKDLDQIEGTPFIYKDFVKARIPGISNPIEIRYNAVQDEMHLKLSDGIYVLSKEKPFNEISIENGNVNIKLLNYMEKNNSVAGYLFEVFKKDAISLFEKRVIVYKEEVVAKTSYESSKPARFRELPPKFFITTLDGKIVELPKSKKELIALFPEKELQMIDFEKKKRINLKNKESIQELLLSF